MKRASNAQPVYLFALVYKKSQKITHLSHNLNNIFRQCARNHYKDYYSALIYGHQARLCQLIRDSRILQAQHDTQVGYGKLEGREL